MGLTDFFKTIPEMEPGEVREFLRSHSPEEYNLIDVRQPQEYTRYHLPGARLIPVKELRGRINEINASKTTITY